MVSLGLNELTQDYGLLPVCYQAIAWTNDDLLWNGPLGTKFHLIHGNLHQNITIFYQQNGFEKV